jgi:hypothetical protein
MAIGTTADRIQADSAQELSDRKQVKRKSPSINLGDSQPFLFILYFGIFTLP